MYLKESTKQAENDVRSVKFHTQNKGFHTCQVLKQVKVSLKAFPLNILQTTELLHKEHKNFLKKYSLYNMNICKNIII